VDNADQIIRKLIADKLGLDEEAVKPGDSFIDDLGADSLDVYELFTDLEKEFKIVIQSEDAEKITTPGSLIKYIKNKIQG